MNLDGMVDFEILQGRTFPVVYRDVNSDPIQCCYCDEYHLHGTEDGHRHTHCATITPKRKLYPGNDVEAITSDAGYIIKTRLKPLR